MNIILFDPAEIGRPLPKRDERAVHLRKVLRKEPGDEFDAGVIGGMLGRGRVESIEPDGSLRFGFEPLEPPPPRHPMRVAVGFPRPIQLRRLLRDLSSLGVAAVDLVGTELGEKSYRDTKLLEDGGARAALVEGAVQARDTGVPALAVYPSLAAWLRAGPWGASPRVLAAPDNVRPATAFPALPVPAGSGEFVLAVGSERGWSEGERAALEAAGFVRASMGDRALRTETACVAAVVLAPEKIGALGENPAP
jgi:16S rRNA (uracil1498-N3)-methyltransferase